MDDITKEFLVESYENLDRMERDLVALEKDPHSKETLGSIFRTIHTLKGSSGFLAFAQMEAVAHVGENLLSKLRDAVLTVNPEIASALLATVDAVRFMLGQIEKTGQPGEKDFSDLVNLLARLSDGTNSTPEAPPVTAAAPAPAPVIAPPAVGAPVPRPRRRRRTPRPPPPSHPRHTTRPSRTAPSAWTWGCWTS